MSDNDKAQNTAALKALLAHYGSSLGNFIPYLAKFQDPLDNPINSIFATNFDQEIASLSLSGPISTAQKFGAIGRAFAAISADAIRNSFIDNGFRLSPHSPTPSASVMSRLLSEGIHPAEMYVDLHCHQLGEYLKDCLAVDLMTPLQNNPLGTRLRGPLFNVLETYCRLQTEILNRLQL